MNTQYCKCTRIRLFQYVNIIFFFVIVIVKKKKSHNSFDGDGKIAGATRFQVDSRKITTVPAVKSVFNWKSKISIMYDWYEQNLVLFVFVQLKHDTRLAAQVCREINRTYVPCKLNRKKKNWTMTVRNDLYYFVLVSRNLTSDTAKNKYPFSLKSAMTDKQEKKYILRRHLFETRERQ